MSATLSIYVARRFLGAFFGAMGAVIVLIVLIDSIELLRDAGRTDAGLGLVLGLALLHAPSLALVALPFVTLLAAMACFARLARSSELVVTRAAGVSVWRLLAPTLLVASILGAAGFAVFNPIASGTLERFETLKARHFDDRISMLSISSTGLWLREQTPAGQTLIRAKRAAADGRQLWDVSVFEFTTGDTLVRRTEAGRAVLADGAWTLHQVRRWGLDAAADRPGETSADTMVMATGLDRDQILESFATPQMVSFWNLPRFIETMERSGLRANEFRMHLQAQLALPLLLPAMVLIGAAFSMRHARAGGLGMMAVAAVVAGLAYFFLANVAHAFGASGAIPAPLAAWAPPAAMSLAAVGLLLHLEDG